MGSRRNLVAAVGIVSLLTTAVACSDGSAGSTTTTLTTDSTSTTNAVPVTTIESATTASPVPVSHIPSSTPSIVHASVDTASLAGYGIGPNSADGLLAELQQRLGPASADSGWVPIDDSFPCHIYAESRTIWWGDIAFSFGRHKVYFPDDGSDQLEAWSVGVMDGFTVPLLGSPTAPRFRVLLDGDLEIGSSEADLYRLIRDSGYMSEGADNTVFVFGHSYFPVSVILETGNVVGLGASPYECYDDTSEY